MLRRIFEPKQRKQQVGGENCKTDFKYKIALCVPTDKVDFMCDLTAGMALSISWLCWGLDNPGFDPGRSKNCLFSEISRSLLESTHWVLWCFPGVIQPGSEVDHSLSSRTEFKNEWSYTPTPLYTPPWRTEGSTFPTSRKDAGSIPDDVIGNFHWHNFSGRNMALGSNQPLTEMSTKDISWG